MSRRLNSGFSLLVLVALTLSTPTLGALTGCRVAKEPVAAQESEATEAPEDVVTARDAALVFIRQQQPDQALPAGLDWKATYESSGLLGSGGYLFASGDWSVRVTYPIVRPDLTIYTVSLANEKLGVQTEVKIDARGKVMVAPDEARNARNVALAYLKQTYGDQAPDFLDLVWDEERITPEGVLGAESYRFTAEPWIVTVSYPVVAPDAVIYTVVAENHNTGFRREGQVNAAGNVTEVPSSTN